MPDKNYGGARSARSIDHVVAPLEETPIATIDAVSLEEKPSNLWRDAWRDLHRRPMFWLSSVLILVVIAAAVVPGLFTSVDPRQCSLSFSNQGPGGTSLLGYTKQGCDVYSRIIYGASTSVTVGLIVIAITSIVGVIGGALAGFFGGWVDTVIMRLGDIFFSIPYILAAVVIMSVFSEHRNVFVIALAIGGFSWPTTARVLRSEVLRVKQSDFVGAATATGLSRLAILFRHVLPNSVAPVIVVTTISLGAAITAEATLSFLGVGLPGSVMSWGNDISQAQRDLRTDPQTLIYPSIALTVTVLSFILLGESLRNALDPKARALR
ncbi:ABC transporter permease [Rathayibacter toxicus]|uniref:ABC transporter permease n=1 Tax=Rathayibacter toxicus TaxID=145458 RepID=A0A0C5BAN3_9MICO|nr:ABC transporter permease [Rathayibacter toxicus]AJM77928.1 peptide ABC transporter permease [Rathayibacter toxicus]ALS57872.1 peptide ABC transporter permease [Rathayibacter toxicus]KKM46932.1 peptide ABC transporter permease [Rathayibacter toxicus]PPG20453.1 ABC transporter permease [Rathayibacter toxicus]PPG45555.1 ABC transporter permease [Rathayibacter toxicus]